MQHLVHSDDVPFERHAVEGSDIDALWQDLGHAAGSVDVGLNRLRFDSGKRPTPAHDHGAEEEIFFVVAGAGLSWRAGETHEVGAGDCLVYLPARGAHTLIAGDGSMEVLAFGERRPAEICHLPRAGVMWTGPTWAADAEAAGHPFEREAEAGGLPLPPVSPRPPWIVHRDAAEERHVQRPGREYRSRRLGVAGGGITSGLRHMTIAPGLRGYPRHCHSAEEELFVFLSGTGIAYVGDEQAPVRAGHVLSRPAGTTLAHAFEAAPDGLEYLAYGQRATNDIVYYPDSNKLSFAGVGVIGRLEQLDYWDGEDSIG
jgi:uncharacterized cupin superfamily protein